MTTKELYELQPSAEELRASLFADLDSYDQETEMQYIDGQYTGIDGEYKDHPYYMQVILPLKDDWKLLRGC